MDIIRDIATPKVTIREFSHACHSVFPVLRHP